MKVMLGMFVGLLVGMVGSWVLFKSPNDQSPEVSAGSDTSAIIRSINTVTPPHPEQSGPHTLDEISQLESQFNQSTRLHQLFVGADLRQLSEFIAAAQQEFSGQSLTNVIRIAFNRLAELDLESAVNQARQLRDVLKHAAGSAILDARPDLSLAQQEDIRSQLGLNQMLDTNIEEIQLAWQNALQQTDGMNQAFTLIPLAEKWAAIDPLAAYNAANDLSREMRGFVLTQILAVWTKNDPEGAWATISDLPVSNQTQQLKSSVLVVMASSNIDLAWEKIGQLTSAEQKYYRSQLLVPWAQQDPEGVLAWLADQPRQDPTQNHLMMLAMGMASEHPEFIDRLIAQLPKSSAALVQTFAFSGLVRHDPVEAERRLALISDPDQFSAAAQQLVNQWSGDNPEYAREWISEQQTEKQSELNSTLARGWARYDQTKAMEFAQSLNRSQGRDQATFAIFQRTQNIEGLERIYPTFIHEETKQNAARWLLVMLQQSDPEKAKLYALDAAMGEQPQQGVIQLRGSGS